MFMFIGMAGFLAFIVYLILSVISGLRKTGKAKKHLKMAAIMFVVFMVGAMNSSDELEEAPVETEATVTDEKQETAKEEQKEEIAPSAVADVKNAIQKGMDYQDYKQIEQDQLNVETGETYSIGNGNEGHVLKATDGYVVVGTDYSKVLSVESFASNEEAKSYADRLVKEAEAAELAAKEKIYEESKIKLSGSGDESTDMINLQAGFAVFEGNYTGGSNFIVKLMDEAGNNVELLVNEIGSYKGKTFAMINTTGNYYLDIKASGNWNFSISQQIPPTPAELPTEISGEGDDVVFVRAGGGNYKFTSTHQGSSNFIVRINGTGLLVNEIGNYSGSTRNKLENGDFAIVVKADGKWSIKIEE
ncbi:MULTISPECIES: hypothetical protein [unclassified Bacillus (in: firmicutes)]|uniref:hypothetical protein n=1 Tax=unclassified Bacillus (in: firmicutes) TaxID=185979 RepID=UPI00080AF7A9|nr:MULTISPECIES: hypothetical protein [unclassified Bacillus (in: firmicutes)]OCA86219.1 hypothetical protein A8L44_07340 [Bacillus sp. FJAT-27986]